MVCPFRWQNSIERRLPCVRRQIVWPLVVCAWFSAPFLSVLFAFDAGTPGTSLTREFVAQHASSAAVTLYVTVKDAKGAGMIGVTVTVQPGNLRQVTNERGDCEFAGLSPGKYNITATREGNVPLTNSVILETNEQFIHEMTLTPLPPQPDVKSEILKLLEHYRGAYEKMDVEGIREVYPGAPARALEQQFSNLKSLTVAFLNPTFSVFDVTGGKAVVVVRLRRKSNPGQTEPTRAEFKFEKSQGSDRWVISSVQFFRQ